MQHPCKAVEFALLRVQYRSSCTRPTELKPCLVIFKLDLVKSVEHIKTGSPTPGPWPIQNQAAQVVGDHMCSSTHASSGLSCVQVHLRKQWAIVLMSASPLPAPTGPPSQKGSSALRLMPNDKSNIVLAMTALSLNWSTVMSVQERERKKESMAIDGTFTMTYDSNARFFILATDIRIIVQIAAFME